MTTVAIIGLGTIGSALAPLAARMTEVSQLTLIDPDSYTESNMVNQSIDVAAPGQPKVQVQADLLRSINPRLKIHAIEDLVENVPHARMVSTILVSCVDNRRARQAINRIAWRCGTPWVDAAVDAASLVRVNAYAPGKSAPCLECAWDERSYDLLEQEYPCDGGDFSVPATATPAELGGLAASLQAGEVRKILGGDTNQGSLVGAQLMLDTFTHTSHIGKFRRNKKCRFDHELWSVETLALSPRESTMADLFNALDAGSDSTIRLEDHSFVTYLDCIGCGRRSDIDLSIFGRLGPGDRTCSCGGRKFAPGFFSFETISLSDLSTRNRQLNLATMGFRSGDVISVANGSGKARHIEISGEIANG